MSLKEMIFGDKKSNDEIRKEPVLKIVEIAIDECRHLNNGKDPVKLTLSPRFYAEVMTELKTLKILRISTDQFVSSYPTKSHQMKELFNIPVIIDRSTTTDVRIE